MSVERGTEGGAARRAEAVRLIVTCRERAPRSPRMERALKRLIWRYLSPATSEGAEEELDCLAAAGEGMEVSKDAEK